MAYANEDSEQAMKRAQATKRSYEAPSVRKVRLDVRASTLSLCLTSTGSSPSLGLCDTKFQGCYLTSPSQSVR